MMKSRGKFHMEIPHEKGQFLQFGFLRGVFWVDLTGISKMPTAIGSLGNVPVLVTNREIAGCKYRI